MKRQYVILKFGLDDSFSPRIADPDAAISRVELIDLTNSFDFGISEFMERVRRYDLAPSENALDLLVLATAIAGVDQRISRAKHSQDGWAREIAVYLPVSDPAVWNGMRPVLVRALNFLSGDRWTLNFRARPKGSARMVEPPKQFNFQSHDCVAMLSGGLDSCIGAIDLLERERNPLFVSHCPPSAGGYQKSVADALRRKFGEDSFGHLRGSNSFPTDTMEQGYEDTTRTRSFLFFAMAAYVASGFQRPTKIVVPENGFIALNVPLDQLRLGALSTRTAHPFYMARWNDILRGLGILAVLENPYATQTKGQMVRNCADRKFLAQVAPRTMSCASPGKYRWVGVQWGHCGHCLPCLIRRGALNAGGVVDNTEYIVDVVDAKLPSDTAQGEYVRSFQLAAARLKARPSLARYAIHKPGPLTDVTDKLDELVQVYLKGMSEIESLLGKASTKPS